MKKKAYEIDHIESSTAGPMKFLVKPFPAPLSDKLEQPKKIIFPDWFAYLLLAVAIIFVLLNIE